MNCWGDYWHNDPEIHNNAENIDGPKKRGRMLRFSRQGLTAAMKEVDILQNPDTADAEGFENS